MSKREASSASPPPTQSVTIRRRGKGYKNGPRENKPAPRDAIWLTAAQVRARYGGLSDMWLWTKNRNDASFPKPIYQGRLRLYSVQELDAYDRNLILKRSGASQAQA
jgi:hypothetical protein